FKNHPQVKGLRVTVPHTELDYALADAADTTAQAVQAASNIIFTAERKMIALNYDVLGIVNDIKNNYKIDFAGHYVHVVGAGGAAKAFVAAVLKESPLSLSITNRTLAKANAIEELFKVDTEIKIIDFDNISD
ncbi:shikimate dehydrogenase, partial [Francisella tularensis subsp. holarctica]|nr:shikimate dehydrogenase [Francisella tularensis subsp. holarctica]